MAALLLTLALVTLLAAILWLLFGARLKLAVDPATNNLLNLLGYAVVLLPFVFVAVFYLVERF